MYYESVGHMVTFALGLFVLFVILALLLWFNKWLLEQLFKSLGGWRSMMQFRAWKRNQEAYFVSDRAEWVDRARAIARNHTVDPESYYTEITIQAICTALQKGELDMPSPISKD